MKELMKGIDGKVRSASVKTVTQTGRRRPLILKRPINNLYPLEVRSHTPQTTKGRLAQEEIVFPSKDHTQPSAQNDRPPRRQAAQEARNWMKALIDE